MRVNVFTSLEYMRLGVGLPGCTANLCLHFKNHQAVLPSDFEVLQFYHHALGSQPPCPSTAPAVLRPSELTIPPSVVWSIAVHLICVSLMSNGMEQLFVCMLFVVFFEEMSTQVL